MTIALHTLARQTIIAALKADATLTAMVPAGQIYPQMTPESPTWPFIRYGAPDSGPLRLDGGMGSEISGVVHVFSKSGGAIADPERSCADISLRVAELLDAIDNVPGPGGREISVFGQGVQIIQDSAEASAFHGIVTFNATIL